MARYLRNTETNAITIVQDDDDATWHTLIAQQTTPPDENTSAKPLYEETSEAWVLQHGGTSSAAAAGGAALVDRAIYVSDGPLVGLAGHTVNWSPDVSASVGRPLLDFTDTSEPTVLIGGVYAASVWVQVTDAQVGKHARLDFELDADDFDMTFESVFDLDAPATSQFPTMTVGGICYIPEGGGIFCAADSDGDLTSASFRLYIQLVTEG